MLRYDAILGEVLQAVKDAGVEDNTYIFATSDHGDCNMEHQQFYKVSNLACMYVHRQACLARL